MITNFKNPLNNFLQYFEIASFDIFGESNINLNIKLQIANGNNLQQYSFTFIGFTFTFVCDF